MCGIAGFLGSFDESDLLTMQRCIAHRGPDDRGVWHDPDAKVGFAFVRLAIIDLHPRGAQPMWDKTRRAVIAFNGEIYNYRELRSQLIAEGFHFNTSTDTEVLLNLYLKHGSKCVSMLIGIFAFAIWDTQTRELTIARDGFGVKPLYIAHTPRGFVFASELKALLALDCVDRQVDAIAMMDYFGYAYCPAPRTIVKGVQKLEPGQLLRFLHDGTQIKALFYELPYHLPQLSISEKDAISELRRLLGQAVERQMVADVEVGAFLSGGLDSSTLVSYATRGREGGRMRCFTIDYGADAGADGHSADLPYAKKVASALGVQLEIVTIGPNMLMDLEKMVYLLDEPSYDPAALNTLYITKMARDMGIKVLLSGSGGDDILSGYRRHVAQQYEKWWSWLPQPVRTFLSHVTQRLPQRVPALRRLSKLFRHVDRDLTGRLVGYYYWLDEEWIREILAPAYREQLSESLEYAFSSALSRIPADTAPLNKMLYLDTRFFLADHNLNYGDKMSMANGVEVRVPFLDPDLVEFAARLPVDFKQRGKIGKWLLRKAMEGHLPHDVIYRPKTGFGAPIRSWSEGEGRKVLASYLEPAELAKFGLFDPVGVKRLQTEVANGRLDGAYSILGVACFQAWARQFMRR